jgi:hypothetical protein
MSRATWREVVTQSPGLDRFRAVMFSRLLPNLREIGLLSDKIRPAYEQAGLARYLHGPRGGQAHRRRHDR